MQLIQMITRIGREIGLNPNVEAEKSQLIELANDAAQEMWVQTDLPRALMEETFTVNGDDATERVTLPGHMAEIRGIRDRLDAIELHDIRPRYMLRPWPDQSGYTFRILAESPIARSIDNALTLYMAPTTEVSLTVTIAGRTAAADHYVATFDENGQGTAEGVLWEDIVSITKSGPTTNDVVITSGDATGAEMARIGARSERSKYTLIQLIEKAYGGEAPTTVYPSRMLDVLYKPEYRPMIGDNDSFQLEGYDIPIIYSAVAIFKLRGLTGAGATEDQIRAAEMYKMRSEKMLNRAIASKIQPEQLMIQYGRPIGDTANLRGLRQRRYTYGNTCGTNRRII